MSIWSQKSALIQLRTDRLKLKGAPGPCVDPRRDAWRARRSHIHQAIFDSITATEQGGDKGQETDSELETHYRHFERLCAEEKNKSSRLALQTSNVEKTCIRVSEG